MEDDGERVQRSGPGTKSRLKLRFKSRENFGQALQTSQSKRCPCPAQWAHQLPSLPPAHRLLCALPSPLNGTIYTSTGVAYVNYRGCPSFTRPRHSRVKSLNAGHL